MNFVLASKSAPKIEGLRKALDELGLNKSFEMIATPSGVPEQPEEEQILEGAKNRAKAARVAFPDAYIVAIENGLRKTESGTIDIAIVVVIAPNGKITVTESAPVTFPAHIVDEARCRGFDKITAGKVLSEHYGSTYGDPQSYLTNGRTNRATMIAEAIVAALKEALP